MDTHTASCAIEQVESIVERLSGGRPVFFFDYDGTLTPIVDHPDDATLGDAMREAVRRLAARYPVAVVSGRDLADVRARVGIDTIFYAGSHGFDICGPNGERHQHGEAARRLPDIDAAEAMLRSRLDQLAGALIERKTFSLAVHYRLVADADLARVQSAVDAAREAHPRLRVQAGKKVFDFQPAVPWDKGRAVLWLLQTIDRAGSARVADEQGASGQDADGRSDDAQRAGGQNAGLLVPFYVGDDVTDEDAFAALAGRAVTVAVLDEPRPTRARYALRSTQEVEQLLVQLEQRLGGGRAR